ncbi:MAG TPA: phosphopantetheine-binding protein, partial [Blastocatellia bacterium]|nr:phosphopantetheine-binding protein [Blastocatellia bacterium]
AQTSIYILDVRQEVVPIGVAGELYTSGEGLARCYEGRAEQTAERFVPDPYSGRAGARMYRTGDLCRYRGDGEIDYLGRVDQQVKVRGYRIELGEVEAALVSHPMVKEAVVVVREVREADKKLVAYVVSAGGEEVTASEMRRHLREKLPDYMVPTAFVKLDKLPMTPNGKVDRKALPAYKAESGAGATEGRQASEVEQVVAGIWKEVLGVEEVGIEENFFEVGGHSLLATQVMARVREAFGVEMELRRMFEAATVADLSLLIEKARNNGTKVKKKAITRVSRELYSVKVSPDGEITIPDKVKIR